MNKYPVQKEAYYSPAPTFGPELELPQRAMNHIMPLPIPPDQEHPGQLHPARTEALKNSHFAEFLKHFPGSKRHWKVLSWQEIFIAVSGNVSLFFGKR